MRSKKRDYRINITKRASNNLWPIYHECNYINTTHERGIFIYNRVVQKLQIKNN